MKPLVPVGPLENVVGDIVFALDSSTSNDAAYLMYKMFIIELMKKYGISTSGSNAGKRPSILVSISTLSTNQNASFVGALKPKHQRYGKVA